METVTSITELPSVPAVFAMYGGSGASAYVAYVGIADKLKRRVSQHLLTRDSRVTTSTSATTLNADYVTELRWWTHPRFAERPFLEAAEEVAIDELNPALRSAISLSEAARRIHYRPKFRRELATLLAGEPAGRLRIPTLADALDRIRKLEQRIEKLESKP